MARRGKNGLPKHCSFAFDRHGKRRIRFRRGTFSTYLPGEIGGAEFFKAYAAAMEGAKPERAEIGASRTKPGSFDSLVVRYYGSPLFTGLKPSTQTTYRGIIERFRARFGQAYVRDFRRDNIESIIGEMSDRRAAANNLLRILRMLFDFALDLDLITANPTTRVKAFKRDSAGFHTWTEEEIASFEAKHPLGTKPRLALALLLYTGQRRGDVVRMGRQHVSAGRIAVVQEKTGTALHIPLHPALCAAIDACPSSQLTFLVTANGGPFTPASFGMWFRRQCNEAGLAHCSAHGLRKAAARRLAEAGLSSKSIASITGHATLKEIERYTKAADQIKLADAAIATIVAPTLSKKRGKVGKTGS